MDQPCRGTGLVLTCEHGGNRIPPAYRELFEPHAALLASHRGWDPGALTLARYLSVRLRAPLLYSDVSRLLVELNRSRHSSALFSPPVRPLPDDRREEIIDRYYLPFRKRVEEQVAGYIGTFGCAYHLSVHSFTPRLEGVTRNAEVGLLYDPGRRREKAWAERIAKTLRAQTAPLRVRMNYPYRGTADGHTTCLRKAFGVEEYAGIELEVNQACLLADEQTVHRVHRALAAALGGA